MATKAARNTPTTPTAYRATVALLGCSRQPPTRQACKAATASTAAAAGCLTDAAAAMITAAGTQCVLAATQSPHIMRPIMRASLWAPPTRCSRTKGLSTANQIVVSRS